MENKCNKTPNTNLKYLDHLYCHTSDSKNYMRASHNNNNNNNSNNNNKNNIHNSDSGNNTMNTGSGGLGNGGNNNASELLPLLKENKQLRSMLILHLDLIQQQAEDLSAKERELVTRTDENETLRTRNAQLETQVAELQKQLQRQLKRASGVGVERTSLPPPPLAKIQCLSENMATASVPTSALVKKPAANTTNTVKSAILTRAAPVASRKVTSPPPLAPKEHSIIGEFNGKFISRITLQRLNAQVKAERSRQAASSPAGEQKAASVPSVAVHEATSVELNTDDNAKDNDKDGKDEAVLQLEMKESNALEQPVEQVATVAEQVDLIEKMELDQIVEDETGLNVEEVEGEVAGEIAAEGGEKNETLTTKATAFTTTIGDTACSNVQVCFSSASCSSTSSAPPLLMCLTPPTTSRGKQLPAWHAPDLHTDDESAASYDSMLDADLRLSRRPTPSPSLSTKLSDCGEEGCKKSQYPASTTCSSTCNSSSVTEAPPPKSRRCAFFISKIPYYTRAWEDEELVSKNKEFTDEAEAGSTKATVLEIPKWTEHELTPSYCIEGTEDLSEDTFLKRHAKLELDEKRRKKWDVQQIREQRRIEKLRRRHCKDELQANTTERQPLLSYYPAPEALEAICYMETLPIQAFGEIIPKLPHNGEGFRLPWLTELEDSVASPAPAEHFHLGNRKEQDGEAEEQEMKVEKDEGEEIIEKEGRKDESTIEPEEEKEKETVEMQEKVEKESKEMEVVENIKTKQLEKEEEQRTAEKRSEDEETTVTQKDDDAEKKKETTTAKRNMRTPTRSMAQNLSTTNSARSSETTTTTTTTTCNTTLRSMRRIPCSPLNSSTFSSTVTLAALSTKCGSAAQAQQRLRNSSFIFVKKRKRHQSSSTTLTSNSAVTLAVASSASATTPTTSTATTTTAATTTITTNTMTTATTTTTTTTAPVTRTKAAITTKATTAAKPTITTRQRAHASATKTAAAVTATATITTRKAASKGTPSTTTTTTTTTVSQPAASTKATTTMTSTLAGAETKTTVVATTTTTVSKASATPTSSAAASFSSSSTTTAKTRLRSSRTPTPPCSSGNAPHTNTKASGNLSVTTSEVKTRSK